VQGTDPPPREAPRELQEEGVAGRRRVRRVARADRRVREGVQGRVPDRADRPGACDGPVEKAAKSSKLTALLPVACAAAEKLLNDRKNGAAWAELKKTADGGSLQGDELKDVQELIAYLEKSAKSNWDDAQAAIQKKDYAAAADLCERLVSCAGMEAGDQGKAKLAELRADPAIVKEIDGGRENRRAEKLEKSIAFKDAIKVYKGVTAKFAGSEAAKRAQERLDAIKKEGLLNMDANCDECRKDGRPCAKHLKG
jgi:hypothetical protein